MKANLRQVTVILVAVTTVMLASCGPKSRYRAKEIADTLRPQVVDENDRTTKGPLPPLPPAPGDKESKALAEKIEFVGLSIEENANILTYIVTVTLKESNKSNRLAFRFAPDSPPDAKSGIKVNIKKDEKSPELYVVTVSDEKNDKISVVVNVKWSAEKRSSKIKEPDFPDSIKFLNGKQVRIQLSNATHHTGVRPVNSYQMEIRETNAAVNENLLLFKSSIPLRFDKGNAAKLAHIRINANEKSLPEFQLFRVEDNIMTLISKIDDREVTIVLVSLKGAGVDTEGPPESSSPDTSGGEAPPAGSSPPPAPPPAEGVAPPVPAPAEGVAPPVPAPVEGGAPAPAPPPPAPLAEVIPPAPLGEVLPPPIPLAPVPVEGGTSAVPPQLPKRIGSGSEGFDIRFQCTKSNNKVEVKIENDVRIRLKAVAFVESKLIEFSETRVVEGSATWSIPGALSKPILFVFGLKTQDVKNHEMLYLTNEICGAKTD